MQRDFAAILDGGIGGCIATAAMSGVMLGARKIGLMGDQPPERLSEKLLHTMGIHHNKEKKQDVLATVLHFGFGGTMGALFGVLHRRIRAQGNAPVEGILYGTLIWIVSYKGWMPALGIMPPPERDHPGRPQAMVFAHWIYGWTLGKSVSASAGLRGITETSDDEEAT